jgi:glutamate carboxypeptidase
MGAVEVGREEGAVLDWVEGRAGDMVDMVRDWAGVNSGSRNAVGLEIMRSKIEDAFGALGAEITPVDLAPSETVEADGTIRQIGYTPAVHVRQRPDAPVRIVLTGHHDTVFPADSHFQAVAEIDSDTLNGPGVADMKGGLIVMLHGLMALERSPWAEQVGYDVLISPDEEIGSLGSAPKIMELGAKADVGMTYEPALADGSLAGARKGSGNFSLRVTGRAAHAGREHHLGRNAIAAAAEFAAKLDRLNGRRERVTSIGSRIDGGGAPNVGPDMAVARFNIRVGDEADADWALGELKPLVAETGARDGIEASLHGGFTRPPKPMTPANQQMFVWTRAAGAAIGLDIVWADTGGVCEGNNLWASGCPNVDTLGVRGAHIHSDRELVKLSSFPERAKLSALMLMKFAQGHFDAKAARALARAG